MARVYVRVPRGSVITIGDRTYTPSSGKTTLPAGTTEFNLQVWRDLSDFVPGDTSGRRVAVYLPAIPVGTTLGEMNAMLQEEVSMMVTAQEMFQCDPEREAVPPLEDFE